MANYKRFKNKKEVLAKIKRYNEIYDIINKLPLVELNEPFYKGWDIKVHLREDIANRKDAKELKQVLNLAYYKRYNYLENINHVKNIRKGIYTYISEGYDWKLKKKYTYMSSHVPGKIEFRLKDFNEKIPNNLKKYFSKHRRTHEKKYKKHDYDYWKCNFPNYYIRLTCKKHLVTHAKMKDSVLESELAEINEWLKERNIFDKLYGNYNIKWNKRNGIIKAKYKKIHRKKVKYNE